MTITTQQISDIRADLGVSIAIFTDDEISRIWDRLEGASTDTLHYDATKGIMIEQLLNNAVKLHDYSVAGDSNKVSQVFDHLMKLYGLYKPAIERVFGTTPSTAIAGIRPVVNQNREKPNA